MCNEHREKTQYDIKYAVPEPEQLLLWRSPQSGGLENCHRSKRIRGLKYTISEASYPANITRIFSSWEYTGEIYTSASRISTIEFYILIKKWENDINIIHVCTDEK